MTEEELKAYHESESKGMAFIHELDEEESYDAILFDQNKQIREIEKGIFCHQTTSPDDKVNNFFLSSRYASSQQEH